MTIRPVSRWKSCNPNKIISGQSRCAMPIANRVRPSININEYIPFFCFTRRWKQTSRELDLNWKNMRFDSSRDFRCQREDFVVLKLNSSFIKWSQVLYILLDELFVSEIIKDGVNLFSREKLPQHENENHTDDNNRFCHNALEDREDTRTELSSIRQMMQVRSWRRENHSKPLLPFCNFNPQIVGDKIRGHSHRKRNKTRAKPNPTVIQSGNGDHRRN